MAGMEYEFDTKGYFYYFLSCLLSFFLTAVTYYLWPRKEQQKQLSQKCTCPQCQLKEKQLAAHEPAKSLKRRLVKIGIIIGWLIVFFIAYKALQVEGDYVEGFEHDWFGELGISSDATEKEIRKAYRAQSLVHHPDKPTGNAEKFMSVTSAFKALTDDDARQNWEKYGNPEGPKAVTVGTVLPRWLIEEGNSMWVLAAYFLLFIILLPVLVVKSWYRLNDEAIKRGKQGILLETSQLYAYCFQKEPDNIKVKQVINVLSGSLEFEKGHNSEIVTRPTDVDELKTLIRDLPNLLEKNEEAPLSYDYSIKARALLHAHFARRPLPEQTLALDQQYVLKKCPGLLNEMVNVYSQLVYLYNAGRVPNLPHLHSLESVMRVSPMCVQGLMGYKSPLLQLPHITEDMLPDFTTKRQKIRSIEQFVGMKNGERRYILRKLSNDQYKDVLNVAAAMPHVTMDVHARVLDDVDESITTSSIVTVTATLVRKSMGELLNKEGMTEVVEYPKVQRDNQKDNSLAARPQTSYEVHCPHFPAIKHEEWWIYITHNGIIVSLPIKVSCLIHKQEIELKLFSPPKPGSYKFTVNLRSDSYLGADLSETIIMEVKDHVVDTDSD